MHNRHDFKKQEIDNRVCYIPTKELAQMAGCARVTVFNAIKKGKLKAVWHATFRNGRKCRAWLVHPRDAEEFVANRKTGK